MNTPHQDFQKAKEELNWKAKRDLRQMCKDAWNYIQKTKDYVNTEKQGFHNK